MKVCWLDQKKRNPLCIYFCSHPKLTWLLTAGKPWRSRRLATSLFPGYDRREGSVREWTPHRAPVPSSAAVCANFRFSTLTWPPLKMPFRVCLPRHSYASSWERIFIWNTEDNSSNGANKALWEAIAWKVVTGLIHDGMYKIMVRSIGFWYLHPTHSPRGQRDKLLQ